MYTPYLIPVLSGTEYDPEQFAGDDIPVLVVGTKQVRSCCCYICSV